jgi:hypothetical protein
MRFSAMIPAALAAVLAAPAAGQELARRVAAAPDGEVRLHYMSREGVCAWEEQAPRGEGAWTRCARAPVRVALTVRGGAVVDVRTRVGMEWGAARGPVTELGAVDPREAVGFLLPLAEGPASAQVGPDAVFAASLAEGAGWVPAVARIARADLPTGTRRAARAWLAQAASNATAMPPGGVRGPVSEEARHRLIVLRNDGAIPELIRIAREDPDPYTRHMALFWLSTSADPRVVDLFEELLRR